MTHTIPVITGPTERADLLASRLTVLYETYDIRFLDPDPLVLVRLSGDRRDREIAGLFAAVLAYGGARTIMKDVRDLFERMDGEPYGFVTRFVPKRDARRFRGWYHRFHRGEDVAALVWAVRRALEEHGSLGDLFSAGFSRTHRDIAPALHAFVTYLRTLDPGPIVPGEHYHHLLPSPADGSACKRMNLFLRWMVRRTGPDLGLWLDIPTSHLVIPLDTHVARISRHVGLTRRSTPNWRMAREITDALRTIDPDDPVRFDYAICRLGILDRCPRRRSLTRCAGCLIREICVL